MYLLHCQSRDSLLEKYINKKFAASDFFDEFIQPQELLVVEFQIHSIVDLILKTEIEKLVLVKL